MNCVFLTFFFLLILKEKACWHPMQNINVWWQKDIHFIHLSVHQREERCIVKARRAIAWFNRSVAKPWVQTCFCIPSLFHQITVVADAEQSRNSCFSPRSPVTAEGTASRSELGKRACCQALLAFFLRGWAQKKKKNSNQPIVFLALEKRDNTEGVKQSGTGDKTKHTAGPTLTGLMAPSFVLNSDDWWDLKILLERT